MRSHWPPRSYVGAVGPGDDVRARDGDRGVLDELLRQVGDRVVVAVGLVGLEHRELGRVRGVRALVAEVAVDLEHPVDAADDGALEEQLGRDAQVQLDVERVGVRDERAGRGAAVHASAASASRPRRSPARRRCCAGCATAAARSTHVAARLLADDQVDVALRTRVSSLSSLCRFGSGRIDFAAISQPSDHDRQLAAAARDDLAADEHVVAEVDELLPARERLLADLGEREHRLDAGAVAGLQHREAQLAGVALVHDAAGDADDLAGSLVGLQVGRTPPAPRGSSSVIGTLHRVRAAAGVAGLGDQALALAEADGLLLADLVVGEVGGRRFGHGVFPFRRGSVVREAELSPARSWRCRSGGSSRRARRSAAAPGRAVRRPPRGTCPGRRSRDSPV